MKPKKTFTCHRCDPSQIFGDAIEFTKHLGNHSVPETKPQPLYYFVNPETDEIVGTAIDLEAALAVRHEFPESTMVFHGTYKRVTRRKQWERSRNQQKSESQPSSS